MAINRELRAELIKVLNITPRRLNQRIRERMLELPMSRENAAHSIAHAEGIDLSKYLSNEDLAEARSVVAEWTNISNAQSTTSVRGNNSSADRAVRARPIVLRVAGVDASSVPGLTPRHASEAKEMADKVYPMLYVFENSIRSIVERVLSSELGSNWWSTSVPRKIQGKAASRIAQENYTPWHGRRGATEIYYIDLNDLWLIIKHQWTHFKELFPNQAWIESLITNDMNVSRRQVAHMNPVARSDVRNVEAAFRKWTLQLQGVSSSIP